MRVLCLVFPLIVASALGQSLPKGVEKVTTVEGITEYRYPNGLHLLVFPDPSKPTITVNITYLVGSRHEGSGEAGMAHLLEHMVFKGSPKHTNIPQELTEHGARPNGTTEFDRTNYFETFQATDENLRWALDLESDRMVNSFVKKEDLDKEFSVVRNEFEMGENSPFNVLFEHTMSTAYLWHSYGRSVIGNRSDIERVPIERLQMFYKRFYQPDNAVLTVAGKVDEPKIVAMVNEYFGSIPKPARTLSPTYTREPAQDGERLTTVRRVGDIQAIFAMYHIPDGANPDLPALAVLAGILTEQPAGRLYKALVDNKKASNVFGDAMQLNEPGVLFLGALLNKTDSLDSAHDVLLATVNGVIKEPPSKEEVDRARTRILKNVDLSLQDSERVGLFISEWAAMGDWRLLYLNRDRLRKVSPEDVQRVAKAYLKTSNRTIGEFIPDASPDRAEIPARTDVEAILKGYKGEEALSAGEAFDPSPANIESRVKRSTLPSGMKISMLAKKTRGNSVRATIDLHFGDVESLKDQDAIAEMAAGTLMRGTKRKNRQEIQDEIDRLKAQIMINGGAGGATATIETDSAHLPAAIGLVAEILREPSFPETEWEQVKKQRITQIEFGKAEPQVLAFRKLNRALYPFPRGDARATPDTEEQLADAQKATLAQAKGFHDKFYGASNAELAVVGDFDPAETHKAVEEAFGSWKSPSHYERLKMGHQKITAVNETIETPDKANAVFLAGLRLELSDNDPHYAALNFANYLLGGGFLNSRLAARIRVKEGLSYGIGSSMQASSQERDGSFRVFAIAAPQNVTKVESAFREELELARKDGFTVKEIEAGKTGWLQSRVVNRSEDAALARMLATRDYDSRTMKWDEDFEGKVKTLPPDQINAIFKSDIDPSQISVVKAGDFKKAQGTK